MPAEVAVLMAAYNADKTVRQAVDSILASTIPCDLFLVDDCSRVPVAEILGPLPRVEIIRLERNNGLAGALNVGLRHILPLNYKYIARMDADDIAYPDRLAKQLAFLDRHPNIAVVGAWTRHIDEYTGTTVRIAIKPTDPTSIRNAMFFNSAISHPTAMIRADVLRRIGLYSENYPAAEDYELLRRIATKFDIANLSEVLLDYRISSHGQSIARRRRQLYDRLCVQLQYFDPLEWRAWAGVLRTLVSFVFPGKLVSIIKNK